MSRTYRKREVSYWLAKGRYYTTEEWMAIDCCGWDYVGRIEKNCRDRKPWGKPPKWFKQMNRRMERAKVKDSMRNERYENIPIFKRSDGWNWT